jgi:hypothetical protein
MGYIKDAPPAPTKVAFGFNILPKLKANDLLINTFHKYNNKLQPSIFKMTVRELNFI